MSYDELRVAVNEVWNQIGEDLLRDLIATIHARCEAVIKVNGMHTPF
jgi:hypothetical protein